MKNLLSLLLAGFIMVSCTEKKETTAPNIIYILADDLGYGDLSSFGQTHFETPHIDQLAAEGMKFTRHYAGNTVCAPSRCTLMTGKHNGHARVRGNQRVPLEPEDVTIAEVLKGQGYRTALIGKWGLGEEGSTGIPTKQGFDYFFGYLNQRHAHNHYPEFLYENEEKVILGNEMEKEAPREGVFQAGYSTNKKVYSNDLFTQKAKDFINKSDEQPFFLYLPLVVPHANNEAGHYGLSGMEVPDFSEFDNKDWPENQKRHAAMIRELDETVGQVMAALKAKGLDENTLVIFTSDNGPHAEGGADPDFFDSNGPLRGIKRALYEGGIRVPTIARWPGKIKAGTENDHISGFVDIPATLAELSGATFSHSTDGISFLPSLLGKEQQKHDFMYWEFYEQGGKQGVLFDNHKLIKLNVNKPDEMQIELYNLSEDLGEENNIAEDHPDLVKKGLALIEQEHTYSKDFHFDTEENPTK
ncbi:arylsulfatase [Jiulongibacter sp. NS-SX5]|uniref:arylsulfatase n=1 Tax=Jiulongibacter sp. NS-SX5 TaxID=3463854 RepID=UPI0040583E49